MKRTDINKVLIIGSGPIVIGQACEFDYSGTQACKALRENGYKIVLVNSNPATIMTDPVMADATYIEPLNVERLSQIIEKERPDALLPNLGGQTGLNMAMELNKAGVLDKYGVKVIGVKTTTLKCVPVIPHFILGSILTETFGIPAPFISFKNSFFWFSSKSSKRAALSMSPAAPIGRSKYIVFIMPPKV